MDLNMPDMDGFAASPLIRQREGQTLRARRTPIVALTAHDAVSYREKVLKADMDDILSKPYSLEDRRACCTPATVRPARRSMPTPAACPAAGPCASYATRRGPSGHGCRAPALPDAACALAIGTSGTQLTTIDATVVSA